MFTVISKVVSGKVHITDVEPRTYYNFLVFSVAVYFLFSLSQYSCSTLKSKFLLNQRMIANCFYVILVQNWCIPSPDAIFFKFLLRSIKWYMYISRRHGKKSLLKVNYISSHYFIHFHFVELVIDSCRLSVVYKSHAVKNIRSSKPFRFKNFLVFLLFVELFPSIFIMYFKLRHPGGIRSTLSDTPRQFLCP